MKVFVHIMLMYIMSATDGLLNSHQFVYQTDRSVDGTVALGLHHLARPGTYARILFSDSNTIIPLKTV